MADAGLQGLCERYGDETLTLPAFAELVGADLAQLRTRRQRSTDFPGPAETSARTQLYRLTDLAAWASASRPDRANEPNVALATDPLRLQAWAFTRSVERCARRFGPEPTRMLLAAVGLLRSSRALGPALDSLNTSGAGLVEELRVDYQAAARTVGHSPTPDVALDDPVRPGVAPALDVELVDVLLDGRVPGVGTGDERIETHASECDLLVRETWALWQLVTGGDTAADAAVFISTIEQGLATLSSGSLKLSHTTGPVLKQLLVALADLRPGQRMLDPACGEADVLIQAAAVTEANSTQTIDLIGRDIDPTAWTISRTRLGMRGLAHDLGRAGTDSLTDPALHATFDRVVVEPGASLWAASKWLARVIALLAPGGVGVVELPIMTLGRDGKGREVKRPVEREAEAVAGHLIAVIATPRNVRPESGDPVALWVVGDQPTTGVLMVDLLTSGVRSDGTDVLVPGHIEALGELVHAHRGGRPLDDVTVPHNMRFAVVERPDRGGVPDLWPASWIDSTATVDRITHAKRQALDLTQELRALVDDSTADVSSDAVLSPLITTEVKRALKRLEGFLSGTETRGRKRPR